MDTRQKVYRQIIAKYNLIEMQKNFSSNMTKSNNYYHELTYQLMNHTFTKNTKSLFIYPNIH